MEGKIALVTGGTRGIGLATARELAKSGCHIALNYLSSRAAAAEAVAEIERLGVKCAAYRGNVGNGAQLARVVKSVIRDFGGIDILVSNAAAGVLKPTLELDERDWDRALAINARALLVAAQAAVENMRERGGGRMVAISSQGATHVLPNYGAVGVAKAALEAVVRYLAVELAPLGIRVNAVCGGVVDTQSLRGIPGHEKMLRMTAERTPAGRPGTPEDIARVVHFLCSPGAEWIVGQTIVVDGGYSVLG